MFTLNTSHGLLHSSKLAPATLWEVTLLLGESILLSFDYSYSGLLPNFDISLEKSSLETKNVE